MTEVWGVRRLALFFESVNRARRDTRGTRAGQVLDVDLDLVMTSCGFGVPLPHPNWRSRAAPQRLTQEMQP